MSGSAELVTVYVPTHRRPHMAMRAVNSVLQQDYPNIELIVCDDGTPIEQSLDMKAYLEAHGALYLRNETAMGACHARNRAIAQASGTLITGLDDDDEFTPERVGELVSEYHSGVSFVASSYVEVSARSRSERMFDAGSINFDQLLHYNKVGNQVLTETTRLRDVGGFDVDFPAMQDYDLWLRLSKSFGVAKKLRSCTYILHTEHEEQRISAQNDKLEKALQLLAVKYQTDIKPKHVRTQGVLSERLKGRKVSLWQSLLALHKDNYRWILAPYIRR